LRIEEFKLFLRLKYNELNGNSLIYTKDLRKDSETTLVPIYMTGLLWFAFHVEPEPFNSWWKIHRCPAV